MKADITSKTDLFKMPSVVSHAWIPIKKDAPADVLKDFQKGGKALETKGLLHAYQGTAVDPNEPNHVEMVARESHTLAPILLNRH